MGHASATALLRIAFKSNGRGILLSLAGEFESPSPDSLVQTQKRHQQMVGDNILWIPYRSFLSARICIKDVYFKKLN